MTRKTTMVSERSPTEVRTLLLEYFYNRNRNATSSKGKKGSWIKISDIKSELKSLHGLSHTQVQSNLTYLLSQGWVGKDEVVKQVRGSRGTVFPSSTSYYAITAAGIDKIEGPGEFTLKKFHDIKIEATGQNIITVGDGNVVNAEFRDLGESLSELRAAISSSDVDESEKLGYVADIDTIQTQLAKSEPNRNIIGYAWESVKAAAAINGCSTLVLKVSALITPFMQNIV